MVFTNSSYLVVQQLKAFDICCKTQLISQSTSEHSEDIESAAISKDHSLLIA